MAEILVDPAERSPIDGRAPTEADTPSLPSETRSPATGRRRDRATVGSPIVAVALGALSMSAARLDGLTALALVAVLPVTSFAALALLIAGFAVELFRPRPRGVLLGA